MKRTNLHSLEPSSARKKIAAAKSNKPFMAALLDRDHRGHKDAVEQWTQLHRAAFAEVDPLKAGRSNGPGAEEPVRALGFAFRGPKSASGEAPADRTARPFKSRLQDTGIADRERSPETGPSGRPVINVEADRIQAILADAPALFEIRDNPDADKGYGDSYADHDAGANAVSRHGATIEREAVRQGVDPNLVKAIMYVENAHGKLYGDISEAVGVADTILPMNIDNNVWSGLGAEPEEFFDPEVNIRVGVTLIRRIRDRIDDPTPAKIASIWIFAGRELVHDYGARVQDVYENRRWLEPLRYDLQGEMSDMEFGVP